MCACLCCPTALLILVQKRQAGVTDTILRYITKMCQASIVFTTFDDLFQRWLERTEKIEDTHEVCT